MKRFAITGEWHGSRLDRFIRASLPGTPFGVTQILLRKGLIFLNGTKALGNARLKAGDVVAVDLSEFEDSRRAAPAEPPRSKRRTGIGPDIRVIYEDDSLLVIDKPAGLVVQPGNQKERGSLLDLLEEYRRRKTGERPGITKARRNQDDRQFQLDLRGPNEEPAAGSPEGGTSGIHFPYTPVHRLDRLTSGALIVAKTRIAARALSRALSRGDVRKTYLAVVEGVPSEPKGEISAPIGRDPRERKRMAVAQSGGRPATTRYETLDFFRIPATGERLSWLACHPLTGRTHQIRVHLAYVKHPIVGDEVYCTRRKTAVRCPRMFLHAERISFRQPSTGEEVEF
ncbi:MAG: RluA family pseudouridine synthase, partial [Candidatus Krumholzibacteria bacterium]|nr:RluA family pseudouridine synthase [Candidatus Krumholzibacteria bacterium]